MQTTVTQTSSLLQKYKAIRHQSESLCDPLASEDYVVQPIVDVSPPKWHLAHTTWFFEMFVLHKFQPVYQLFNQQYNYLFNSYYENAGDRVLRADRGNLTRPGIEEIYQYRKYVDQQMEQFLTCDRPLDHEVTRVLGIGLQHEQQHQELLATDIKYILGHNPVFPAYHKHKANSQIVKPIKADFLEVPEGLYQIGHQGKDFCYDNELGCHQVFLPGFKIMNRLVTNREYLEFMRVGGYHDHNHWMMEGWEWVKVENINAPLYWHQIEGEWYHYTLSGLEKVDPDAPVSHISFYEADAYSRWKGFRLPTEFEWETACRLWQPEMPVSANFQDTALLAPAVAPAGNHQFFGDCWEWTGSAYRPYPYYKKEEGALGEYNGKFMINQMVLRGGSCATPANHIRPTYRNFFHPHLRWQFTGIRLATH
jgi:ergothioneine biosynthesis protein EgtB